MAARILIIDDLRKPKREAIIEFLDLIDDEPPEFFVARTAIEAITFLEKTAVDYIFFDHDLGYGASAMLAARYVIREFDRISKPRCIVHTSNPVGGDSLVAVLGATHSAMRIYHPEKLFTVLDTPPNRDIPMFEQRIVSIETDNNDTRYVFINLDARTASTTRSLNHAVSTSMQIVTHDLDTAIIGEDLAFSIIDHYGEIKNINLGQIVSIERMKFVGMYGVTVDDS